MKKNCPYCAEEIQGAAIVCRFCGRDICQRAQTRMLGLWSHNRSVRSRLSSLWRATPYTRTGARGGKKESDADKYASRCSDSPYSGGHLFLAQRRPPDKQY
jgi:hypothetical protein